MDSAELMKVLGANIKRARTGLGLSQQQLAEYAGLSVSHISDLELGRAWVSAESMVRLSQALLRSPWQLLLDPHASDDSRAAEIIKTEESLNRFAEHVRRKLDDVVADAYRETYAQEEPRPDDSH